MVFAPTGERSSAIAPAPIRIVGIVSALPILLAEAPVRRRARYRFRRRLKVADRRQSIPVRAPRATAITGVTTVVLSVPVDGAAARAQALRSIATPRLRGVPRASRADRRAVALRAAIRLLPLRREEAAVPLRGDPVEEAVEVVDKQDVNHQVRTI